VNGWLVKKLDVYEDYKIRFGGALVSFSEVAFIADSNDIKDSITAYYKGILFHKNKLTAGIPGHCF